MHIFTEDRHKFIIGKIDIYKGHVDSGNHDIFCSWIAKIKHIVDHLFFFVFNDAVFFTYIDEGTQFMFSHGICLFVRVNMQNDQYTFCYFIYNENNGSKENHKSVYYSWIGQGQFFSMDCCQVFGGYLTENENQQSQDAGCDSYICVSQNLYGECSHERRNRHIYNVVSD